MHIKSFSPLSKARLKDILNCFSDVRVAVIGDFCLDAYWDLDLSASEVSLETGKMTQPVRTQRYALGGAGNVTSNLRDLGVGEIYAFGILGDDPFGHALLSLLKAKSNCDGIVIGDPLSWQTLTYCKPYNGKEEEQRLDMGCFNRLNDSLAIELIERLEGALPLFDMIIVNQQFKTGIHTSILQDKLADLIREHKNSKFIYDGRHIQDVYKGAWLKMNDQEALTQYEKEIEKLAPMRRDTLIKVIECIFDKNEYPVVVTRGKMGCMVYDGEDLDEIPGIQIARQIDPVGAGDAFLAGLAVSLACGIPLGEAAQVGNYTAAVTITQIGQTGTATPAEIMEIGTDPEFLKVVV